MWNADEAFFRKSTSIVFIYISLVTGAYSAADYMGQSGIWYGIFVGVSVPLLLICRTRWKQHVVPERRIAPVRRFSKSKSVRVWEHGGLEPRIMHEKMQDGSLGPKKFAIEIWYYRGKNDRKSFAIPLSLRTLLMLRNATIKKLKKYPELQTEDAVVASDIRMAAADTDEIQQKIAEHAFRNGILTGTSKIGDENGNVTAVIFWTLFIEKLKIRDREGHPTLCTVWPSKMDREEYMGFILPTDAIDDLLLLASGKSSDEKMKEVTGKIKDAVIEILKRRYGDT